MRHDTGKGLALFICVVIALSLGLLSCRGGAQRPPARPPEIVPATQPATYTQPTTQPPAPTVQPPTAPTSQPTAPPPPPAYEPPSYASDAERRLEELARKKGDELQHKETVSRAITSEAEALFHQYRYDEARDKLIEALRVDPSNRAAQELLNRIGMLLGDTGKAIRVVTEDYADTASVTAQQARMEALMYFNHGEQLFNEKKYGEALEKFRSVIEKIRWASYELYLAEIEQKTKDYIKVAEELQKQYEADLRKMRQQMAEDKARDEEERRLAQVRQKAKTLYETAMLLYETQNFTKSEEYCKQILEFDPKNEKALRLLNDAINARHSQLRQELLQKKTYASIDLRYDSEEAVTPQSDLLKWAPAEDWERIRKREPAGRIEEKGEETPVIADLKQRVKRTPIEFEFTRTPLRDVIEFIKRVTRISIVVDPTVLDSGAGDLPIDLKLTTVPVETALDIVIRKIAGLDYLYKEGYLFITTKETAAGEAMLRLYEVRDLLRPLPSFPGPSTYLTAGAEEEAGPAGIEYGFEEEAAAPITGEELVNLVKETIPGDWNGDYTVDVVGTGQLMVINTRGIHDQVQKLLDSLRQFTGSMVHIEARFVTVDDNFLEDVGVDIQGLGGQVGQNPPAMTDVLDGTLNAVGAGFWRPIDQSGERLNISYRQVNIFEREEAGDEVLRPSRGDFTNAGGLALQFALLKEDAALNTVLRAVEKSERATVVSAMRITVYNTQRANVAIISQRAFIADLDVEIAEEAWIYDPIIQVLQYGIVLDVRPIISNDKKYITLELQPSVSRLELMRNLNIITGDWFEQPPEAAVPLLQLPWVYFTRAQTTVRVPDRGTLIVGGLRDVWHSDMRTETPFLGRIPLLNFFFKRQASARQKRNTIILVTARIIDVAEEEKTK